MGYSLAKGRASVYPEGEQHGDASQATHSGCLVPTLLAPAVCFQAGWQGSMDKGVGMCS